MDIMTRVRSQWDRVLAAATAVAGVVVLILGWVGVSGTAYPAEQLPYFISGGIGALFLLGASATLWLSADLHDEWRKLDRIEHAIRAEPANGGEQTVRATRPVSDEPANRAEPAADSEQTTTGERPLSEAGLS